uniref:Solute carrier family 38 member 8 n=1 Tax=Xiphophorus maculatus TaxID=8083 RepID=A0A3B5PWI6_XIPMA
MKVTNGMRNPGLVILGYASSVSRQKTYQDVVREVCGRAVGQLCEVCFCFNLFMISVAFLVVVQDQLEKRNQPAGPWADMPYHWYTDQRFALFIMCLLIILPLSIPKEIGIQKYTRYSVFISPLITSYIFFFKFSECFFLCQCIRDAFSTWTSMFSVVPTICFGFQVRSSSTTFNSMENQKLLHWTAISVLSMFFCLLTYTLTGVYGFLTFGQGVASDILMSYPGNDVVMIISSLCGFEDPHVVSANRRGVVTHSFESRCRVVLTVAWISFTLLIAMFVPDMADVISVIGGISAFFIFIFPGNCSPRLSSDLLSFVCHRRDILTIWGVVTIVVGAFIFGQSTTIAVMEIFHKFKA